MRLKRFGIRSRITGGSVLIAILMSVAAGFIIHSQLVRIDYEIKASYDRRTLVFPFYRIPGE